MLDPINYAAYKAGVRLTQFLKLIPGAPSIPKVEMEASMNRVQLALDELYYELKSLDLLRNFVDSDTIKKYISEWHQQDPRDSAAGIIRQGKELIEEFSRKLCEADLGANDWLRLGLEIADSH